jgi:hypothetical protein
MRARSVATVTLVLVLLAGTGGPAGAGGGATFEFDEDILHPDYLAPGQKVTGEMFGAYFDHRRVEGGPFYAFLEPISGGEAIYDGPPKLSRKAIKLGRIHVGRFRSSGGGYVATATVSLEVPAVPPGRYLIEYCNSPCKRPFGNPGANWATDVTVVATPAMAHLRHRLDRLESRLRRFAWREDQGLRHRMRVLRGDLSELAALESDQQQLAHTAGETSREMSRLRSQVRDVKAASDTQRRLLSGLAAVALLALVCAAILLRRRTHVRPQRMDDGVPEWLVRDVERRAGGDVAARGIDHRIGG